jgi:hypothetical protein
MTWSRLSGASGIDISVVGKIWSLWSKIMIGEGIEAKALIRVGGA